jgi:TRAP-type C4-dicarboxylate transport system permease large subunit
VVLETVQYLFARVVLVGSRPVTRAAPPWMLVLIITLMVITYIPWLSLFLIGVLY